MKSVLFLLLLGTAVATESVFASLWGKPKESLAKPKEESLESASLDERFDAFRTKMMERFDALWVKPKESLEAASLDERFDALATKMMEGFDTFGYNVKDSLLTPSPSMGEQWKKLGKNMWSSTFGKLQAKLMGNKTFLHGSSTHDGMTIDYWHKNGKDFLEITSDEFSKVNDLEILNNMRKSLGLKIVDNVQDASVRHFTKPSVFRHMSKSDCKDGYCVTYTFTNGKEQLRLMGEVPDNFNRNDTLAQYRKYFNILPTDILPAIQGSKEGGSAKVEGSQEKKGIKPVETKQEEAIQGQKVDKVGEEDTINL